MDPLIHWSKQRIQMLQPAINFNTLNRREPGLG